MQLESSGQDRMAAPMARDHFVQLYRREDALVEAVAFATGAAIARQEAVVVVATPAHAEAFGRAWRTSGLDPDALVDAGQLTLLDAAQVLARFMVDGRPDRARFEAIVREIVERTRLRSPFRALLVYGEMVDLLWTANLPAAVRLEELWNEALREHRFALYCAYCLDRSPAPAAPFPADLGALHTHLVSTP